jgi:hypothetical protein
MCAMVIAAWAGIHDAIHPVDGSDGRPWWGRSILALVVGALMAIPFGLAAAVLHLP